MGEPKFSDELFERICNRIATSADGLQKICAENGLSSVSFYSWISGDENLLNRYARARDIQADLLADQIIEIADDSSNDTKTIVNKAGEPIEVENIEWTNRSKLRVEARKWIAAKLKPKKYGDKLETETKLTINNLPDWIKGDVK